MLILNNTFVRKEDLFLEIRQFQAYQIQRAIPGEVLPLDLSILLQILADRLHFRMLKISISLYAIDEAIPSGDDDGWFVDLLNEAMYFAKFFGRYEALVEQFVLNAEGDEVKLSKDDLDEGGKSDVDIHPTSSQCRRWSHWWS